jgi:hypothetical protein
MNESLYLLLLGIRCFPEIRRQETTKTLSGFVPDSGAKQRTASLFANFVIYEFRH